MSIFDERKCGACTLCCTAMAVPELDKPNGVPCEHLTASGCGIYDERPQSCRDFACAWLRGHGGIDVRPDRTGGVLHLENDTSEDDLGTALVIYADPNGKDPRKSRYVQKLVERHVKAKGTAVLMMGDERTMYTHPGSEYSRKLRMLQAQERARLREEGS